jgi:hypothetical protein
MTDKVKEILLEYFFDQLDRHHSCAGCNDMDSGTFSRLTEKEKGELHAEFLAYDREANPDQWEPMSFAGIPDFCWLGFLRRSMKEPI